MLKNDLHIVQARFTVEYLENNAFFIKNLNPPYRSPIVGPNVDRNI